MMMESLPQELLKRGIDDPRAIVGKYPDEVIERSIEHFDTKRGVGPGFLVSLIRKGGPAPAPAAVPRQLLEPDRKRTCVCCGCPYVVPEVGDRPISMWLFAGKVGHPWYSDGKDSWFPASACRPCAKKGAGLV
jgi:hypothetical protein